MKSLVVLSALVSLAIAAPSPLEQGIEVITKEIPSTIPEFINREKKSPQLQEAPIQLIPESVSFGIEAPPGDFKADIESPVSARSHFDFKGPIVVKKNSGYHLYRDSEEERAASDPQDSCGKQMRVKLCNQHTSGKSSDLTAISNKRNANMQHADVDSSIKIAKEAIESLQKDMQKFELDSNDQKGHWKHGETALDSSMHQNIETVRQALQHVQGRLGNIESMNLQATTFKETEALKDITKGKTEEERLAQWKEAMENIQRNVEVARNIEDSFKSAEQLEAIDTSKMIRNDEQTAINHNEALKARSTVMSADKHVLEEIKNKKIKNIKSEDHLSLEKNMNEGHEMAPAASEQKIITKHFDSASHNSMKTTGKSNEISIDVQSKGLKMKHNDNIELKKEKSSETSLKTSFKNNNNKDDNEMSLRNSENTHHHSNSLHSQAAKEVNFAHNSASAQNKNVWEGNTLEHQQKEKSAWEDVQHEGLFMKSAQQANDMKFSQEKKMHDVASHSENKASMKSTEQNSQLDSLKTDDFKRLSQTDNEEMASNVHISHQIDPIDLDKELHAEALTQEKSAGLHIKHPVHTHIPAHHHHVIAHAPVHHHMPGHGLHLGNGHSHYLKHGKSVDVNTAMQPSLQMSMHENTAKSAMDSMIQWKHPHDLSRSSYGGGYSLGGLNLGGAGGSQALGVFPNAKVGGCGIPLLLSCSPSVVQGSLAKSHSAYGAAAYRAEDEFSLKNKRDVIITKDLTGAKAKHTMTKKNTDILETPF